MSLKKKLRFDELVAENRRQILEDRKLMEQIENNLDMRMHQTVKKVNEN
ncbi:FbpB family small basic protein [Oceanobacillus profundus]|uniref:FbpB family small basic protein n=1 Tax=Oceanobacillus profundus TaxID=372463 RepID=A0A417Y9V7_9BACI|nr:FbpB family small basic protein [Oceanobacillus profundus]MBR3121478.1 FbpB family small basic protein [Oceanobacillus sp.]MDO6451133.1 FbpB family small basic protein [Oceanobacillus profundus]PAE29936.1 FbpB family small basic protein [Paenibacillus sp. 7884-2]RHW29472.1 FbpB family small basic protein [Oceanobacillus profundus]